MRERPRRRRLRELPGPTPPDRQPPGTPPRPPSATFDQLDDAVPLLLLPVRLETRFLGGELRVRIYPDQLHLDDHDPLLTAAEAEAGRAHWKAWLAAADDAGRAAARDWLVSRIPARRAAWVARATRPTLDDGRASPPPRLELSDGHRPGFAGALPERWCVLGYTRVAGALQRRFAVWGAPIPDEVALSVDPAAADPWSHTAGELPVDAGLAWMVDYSSALANGMAVTVTAQQLGDLTDAGLALVIAIGVSGLDPTAAAAELDDLLTAHTYSDGLAFVPQGTPTNNTDQASAGWSFREPDAAALLARELDGADRATTATSSGVRLAAALGLAPGGVLARVELASSDEEAAAAAMNRALWPVTWGQYFDHLLASQAGTRAIESGAIAAIKSRFIAHVRGGATLPALRTAGQPYGVLPVRLAGSTSDPGTSLAWTEHVLGKLRASWTAALPSVPRLDPVQGASGGSGSDAEARLVEILSSLPYPRRFLLRGLRDWREDSYGTDWTVLLALFGLVWLAGDDPLYGHDALSVIGRWGWARHVLDSNDFVGLPSSALAPIDATSLAGADAQLAALRTLRSQVGSLTADGDGARAWIDYMIGQVEAHRARQASLDALDVPLTRSGIIANAVHDPVLFYGLYDEDDLTRPWVRSLVTPAVGSIAGYLASLAERVPALQPSGAPVVARRLLLPAGFHADAPLLYQLLDAVVEGVPLAESSSYRTALDTLGDLPAEDLELRLRETLGLATHRLDAWYTSLARERLDAMRVKRPRGLQLGGYGWVIDLVPDQTGTRESQGFIHAPSLQQASTAAILRAGWNIHGTDDAASTLAVDLRGARMRDAAWLLDGIRQGQALGELLGYRFERRLHDDGLDAWIDPVRRAVLEADGVTLGPRGSVDGLRLAELHAAGGLAAVLTSAGADATRLGAALDDVPAALDAVGDAGIAESIHQVAQGNTTRAAATLDAISTGDVPPPELTYLRTPPAGPSIEHRAVALLTDGNGWGGGPRATFDPALEAWAGHLLGDAARAACWLTLDGDLRRLSLADIGVSALDLVFEAPAGDPGPGSTWARRILAWVRDHEPAARAPGASLALDVERAESGDISLAELAELARAIGALLGRARPLDARDLSPASSEVEPARDVATTETHVTALGRRLRDAAGALSDLLPAATEAEPAPVGTGPLGPLRDALSALAGLGLPAAIPSAGWHEDERAALYAQAWSVKAAATKRLAALDVAVAGPAPTSDDQRLARARAELDAIFGGGYPLLPRIAPAEAAIIAASFARSSLRLDGELAAPAAWLQQLARVRTELARLDEVTSLAEWLGGGATPLVVAQFPDIADERWVARTAPAADSGGRLALCAIDRGGLGALGRGEAFAGLVIDSWVERIPATHRTTGVTFHFDAPAARAPQVMLMAVPPEGSSWTFDLVVDTVRATLDDAQLRAVGPETLGAHGHHLPAIYAPATLDPGEEPA